ncbi:unnamed protein product [Fraxinus pennsylvanica]|uniref:Kinesin motor domain-containing protein n=1 Tax=Fraxinus pennsylvanica TaxID=56036 RepID=A0AAD1YZG5_9LAMI|nr:unnamed protein product [Fraxinus pennsylvanica]
MNEVESIKISSWVWFSGEVFGFIAGKSAASDVDESASDVDNNFGSPIYGEFMGSRGRSSGAFLENGFCTSSTVDNGKGSQEKPGLLVMAMSEILSKAMDFGKSVSVSLYEMIEDHAYDLLDPKHIEVQILEGPQGKIHLKGLSQASKYDSQIKTKFSTVEDLACSFDIISTYGYKDPRRNIKDGTIFTESNRTNKSLYTMLNVVYALNTDEKHLPYRESKLTRILQESLGGKSPCFDAYMLESFLLPRLCLLIKFSFSITPKCQASVDRIHKQKSKFSSQSERSFINKKWEDAVYVLDHVKTDCFKCAPVEKEG